MIRLIRLLLCYSRQDSRKQASCRIATQIDADFEAGMSGNPLSKFRAAMTHGRVMRDARTFLVDAFFVSGRVLIVQRQHRRA